MQTTFAEQVGAPFGLRRGTAGSKAKHVEIKSFYGKLQQELAAIQTNMERLAEQQASQDTRGDELDQRGADVWAREQALERDKLALADHRQKITEQLKEALALAERVEQDDANLIERKNELDAREVGLNEEVERQGQELADWEHDLQPVSDGARCRPARGRHQYAAS